MSQHWLPATPLITEEDELLFELVDVLADGMSPACSLDTSRQQPALPARPTAATESPALQGRSLSLPTAMAAESPARRPFESHQDVRTAGAGSRLGRPRKHSSSLSARERNLSEPERLNLIRGASATTFLQRSAEADEAQEAQEARSKISLLVLLMLFCGGGLLLVGQPAAVVTLGRRSSDAIAASASWTAHQLWQPGPVQG